MTKTETRFFRTLFILETSFRCFIFCPTVSLSGFSCVSGGTLENSGRPETVNVCHLKSNCLHTNAFITKLSNKSILVMFLVPQLYKEGITQHRV